MRIHQLASVRMICLFLCVVCLLACIQPVFAAQLTPGEKITLTCIVHSKASETSTAIGKVKNGTALTVLGEQGDFYEIDCYDMNGYIAKSQVRKTADGYFAYGKVFSEESAYFYYTPMEEALRMRYSILLLSRAQLGTPYVYGGKNPGGFDCSGFTSYIFQKHDILLHRRASQQLQDGIIVSKAGMQIGDLVFFREPEEVFEASHVGIYVGNNKIIHAGSRGISYGDLSGSYFSDYFLCARRIFDVNMDAGTWTAAAAVTAGSGRRTERMGIRTLY